MIFKIIGLEVDALSLDRERDILFVNRNRYGKKNPSNELVFLICYQYSLNFIVTHVIYMLKRLISTLNDKV